MLTCDPVKRLINCFFAKCEAPIVPARQLSSNEKAILNSDDDLSIILFGWFNIIPVFIGVFELGKSLILTNLDFALPRRDATHAEVLGPSTDHA